MDSNATYTFSFHGMNFEVCAVDLRHLPVGTHSLAPKVLADCQVLACPVGIPEMACRAEARQSEGWSAWQDLHLQPSRFERDTSANWATRGGLPSRS
jgi:hypothetical protein